MEIFIKQDKTVTEQKASEIHGNYPYKLYLEIAGTDKLGRFIAVVSNSDFDFKDKVDKISIKEKEKSKVLDDKILKPNMILNGSYITYMVKEVSILDIRDEKMNIYRLETREKNK